MTTQTTTEADSEQLHLDAGMNVRGRIMRRLRILSGGELPVHAISSADATPERMEAEPDALILLSDEQAHQLRQIEDAAERRDAAVRVDAPFGPIRARRGTDR